jgi:hypothetical protein
MILADLVARLTQLEDGLEEAHEKVCGCDDPGRHDWCIAQPRDLYALLNDETKPSRETWRRVARMIGENR